MLSLKLLVVEDDPASLELMSEVLRSLEAEVRPFSNSQETAALVHQQKFGGIFLDLEMPNLDGVALAATYTVGSKVAKGRTWNLSQGGVQVEAVQLKAGDNVRISFRLPSSGVTIDAHGTVVWAKEERQGIQFNKLSNAAHEALHQFISQVEGP